MYHEIEGQLNIEPLIFDEEELIARGNHYPYKEIESIEITSAPLFSAYGILTVRTQGKDIAIPFVRSKKPKLERALRELEKLLERGFSEDEAEGKADAVSGGTSLPGGFGQNAAQDASQPSQRDPYDELKKLKELLDLDIITKEEFETKKKQLLDL